MRSSSTTGSLLAALAFALAPTLAVGCGSSTTEPTGIRGAPSAEPSDMPDAASTPAPDAAPSNGQDAAPSGAGDGNAPAGFPASFTKYGTVGVRWSHDAKQGDFTDMAAVFVDFGASGGACTSTPVGACVHVRCPAPDGGGPTPNADPGTIAIASAAMQAILTYPGPSVGDAMSTNTMLWPPGASLSMTSSGATVPAWSTAVTMPPLATVTASFPASGATFPRASDFSVTWQGAPELVFSLEKEAGGIEQMYCVLAGGQGTVPASALGLVPAGSYTVELFAANRQYLDAGGWSIRATADTDAVCAGGLRCSANGVTVE